VIQETARPRRAAALANRFSRTLKTVFPEAPGIDEADLHHLSESAIKVKQQLMVGAEDHRVHYYTPDVPFDPLTMSAVLPNGCAPTWGQDIGSKKVALCLFPALMQQASQPLSKDATLSDALAINQNYFSTYEEISDPLPRKCIAKATVLLL
jgi:hypothetical protein